MEKPFCQGEALTPREGSLVMETPDKRPLFMLGSLLNRTLLTRIQSFFVKKNPVAAWLFNEKNPFITGFFCEKEPCRCRALL